MALAKSQNTSTRNISSHSFSCENFVQVEFHPRLYQKELLEYCKRKGIQLQAYTSLGQGKVCCSALWPLDIQFVLWPWILGEPVLKQQHVCVIFIDMKDSIDIETDMWLNYIPAMYKTSFSKQTAANCIILFISWFVYTGMIYNYTSVRTKGHNILCKVQPPYPSPSP